MRAAGRHARQVVWLLALVGFVLMPRVGPTSGRPMDACPSPRELRADGHFSTHVGCADPVAGAPVRGPARMLFGLGIDPNRASAATLEALPGIGPKRAESIVAARVRAPYREPADLQRVRGIGPVTVRGLAPWLAFGAVGSGPPISPEPAR